MKERSVLNKEANVNGVKIHYKIAGSGSPLILLHGAPLTSRSWQRIMPKLAETYTVIAPDLRGYGQSDKPLAGYTVHTMAEDIRQLVLQLGLGPFEQFQHLAGTVQGGVISVSGHWLIEEQPEQITRELQAFLV